MKIKFLAGLVGFYSLLLALSENAQAMDLAGQAYPAPADLVQKYSFQNYDENGKMETWYLSIDKPKLLPTGGTPDFITTLRNTYSTGDNKWTFSAASTRPYADSSLAGYLDIIQYSGCIKGKSCESSLRGDPLGSKSTVGGIFIAAYKNDLVPVDPFSSPIKDDASIKWIQYIDSSYTTKACRDKGITSLKLIDNSCDFTKPYYPLEANKPRNQFVDHAGITDFLRNEELSFKAQTYIVQEIRPREVVIYDGVSWGWKNSKTRPPTVPSDLTSALSPSQAASRTARRPPCPAGMPIQSCISFGYDFGGLNYANSPGGEIANSQLSFDEPAAAPESVPTPALLPGMIATGIYHGRKWRKRKQRNSNSDDLAA